MAENLLCWPNLPLTPYCAQARYCCELENFFKIHVREFDAHIKDL